MIAEEQKRKISILREEKFNFQEEIDKMEMDARSEHDNFMKTAKQNIALKEKMKALEMELIEKEKVETEVLTNDLQHELAVRKNKDLEDELFTKDQKIFDLTEVVERLKENEINFKSSSSLSLDKEITPMSKEELELNNLVKDLETEIDNMKANEAAKRNQRLELMNREMMLLEYRKSNFESLKQSISKIKATKRSFPRCFYGIKCKRLFCKFDHSHLFRKDNRTENLHGRSSLLVDKSSLEFLCDHCGEVCTSLNEFSVHVKRKHTGSVKSTPIALNCNVCDATFDRQKALVMHVKNYHRELECTMCDDLFPSEEELDVHRQSAHAKDDHPQCFDSNNVLKHKRTVRSHIGAKHETINHQKEIIESEQNLASDNELSEYSESSSISFKDFSETEDSETESGGSST